MKNSIYLNRRVFRNVFAYVRNISLGTEMRSEAYISTYLLVMTSIKRNMTSIKPTININISTYRWFASMALLFDMLCFSNIRQSL